jgi:hypothetical protein
MGLRHLCRDISGPIQPVVCICLMESSISLVQALRSVSLPPGCWWVLTSYTTYRIIALCSVCVWSCPLSPWFWAMVGHEASAGIDVVALGATRVVAEPG